jgi:hypothetical protein
MERFRFICNSLFFPLCLFQLLSCCNSCIVFNTAFHSHHNNFSAYNLKRKQTFPVRDVIHVNSAHEAQEHNLNKNTWKWNSILDLNFQLFNFHVNEFI